MIYLEKEGREAVQHSVLCFSHFDPKCNIFFLFYFSLIFSLFYFNPLGFPHPLLISQMSASE